MKKFLAGLCIAFIVLAAIMGALAVVPHVHGNDANHSRHASCPLYQAGMQNADFSGNFHFLLWGLFIVAFLSRTKFSLSRQFVYSSASPRAPPAAF